jgi:hypothetical protein
VRIGFVVVASIIVVVLLFLAANIQHFSDIPANELDFFIPAV